MVREVVTLLVLSKGQIHHSAGLDLRQLNTCQKSAEIPATSAPGWLFELAKNSGIRHLIGLIRRVLEGAIVMRSALS
ncbi:hypothetical protein BSP99_02200 [Corynebacterium glutamicum]|nr:hypothetical protein AC079_02330 [Corynebacterium glutamicum]ANU32657.1 hypothetical protein BBD29_02150 [Corynebacterium glutamicum]APT06400.1 hypothetical protein BSP99_02200 [Corynebacterium glutamicum]QWQ83323.1 hypothetical protein B5C28_02160 [Corynebacterium glutamicum]